MPMNPKAIFDLFALRAASSAHRNPPAADTRPCPRDRRTQEIEASDPRIDDVPSELDEDAGAKMDLDRPDRFETT